MYCALPSSFLGWMPPCSKFVPVKCVFPLLLWPKGVCSCDNALCLFEWMKSIVPNLVLVKIGKKCLKVTLAFISHSLNKIGMKCHSSRHPARPHPIKWPSFTFTWSHSGGFQATVGCLKFKNPKRLPFHLWKYFHFINFHSIPLWCLSKPSDFSSALRRSQMELCPAEELLVSLSHSSLTHKQHMTHEAISFHLPDSYLPVQNYAFVSYWLTG